MRRESRSDNHNAPANSPACSTCVTKDFLMGDENSNTCRHANETKVLDADRCLYAAIRNKAEVPRLVDGTLDEYAFKLQEEYKWERIHPHGCFHAKCHWDNTKDCYYLNTAAMEIPDANDPGFSGTPVCERQRYEDGVPNSHGGCPPDYALINNESTCVETCGILDDQCSDYFRVGLENYSMHFHFPQGCFSMRDVPLIVNGSRSLTRVYFNPTNTNLAAPVNGTPICEVATPLDCLANPGCGVSSATGAMSAAAAAVSAAASSAVAAVTGR